MSSQTELFRALCEQRNSYYEILFAQSDELKKGNVEAARVLDEVAEKIKHNAEEMERFISKSFPDLVIPPFSEQKE